MKYDLSNFYENLKAKFNKSTGNEILIYLLEEFSKTIRLKDARAIIFVGNELSSFLRVKGQTDFAYKIYNELEKIVIENYGRISKEYASLLLNISNCDIVSKNYDIAIENLNKTERILEDIKENNFLKASLYNNRSQAFRAKNMLDKAQKDIEIAIKLVDNKEKIAVSKINLAEILLLREKYGSALVNINEAIEYYESNNLRLPHLANAYATAANIFYNMKEYNTSIHYFEKAIEIFDKSVGDGEVKQLLVRNLEEAKRKRDIL